MTQQPDDLVERMARAMMSVDGEGNYKGVLDPTAIRDAEAAAKIARQSDAATITALRQQVAELEGEAKFLCDRIDQLDWSMDFEDFARDFTGHVEPSWERLRSIIRNRSNDHEG